MKMGQTKFLRKYFEEKTQGTASLTTELFTSALKELGVRLNEDDVSIIFRTMDLNSDGVLDLEEFKKAVRFPSTMEQFISQCSVPLRRYQKYGPLQYNCK